MFENVNLDFPVTVYGKLEKYNDTISKGRCRIFYKGGNRNGTYITDEFAEILLSSIPYAPVKGIYEEAEGDYSDHGEARTEGRIYGIVPENPNLAWEEHEDEDGEIRTYACVDVLIFTGLYAEAEQIVGKGQSMEIYPPSIKGNWKIINGKKYFVYESGHFLGLQVLGDEVEPCFEGAAFFSLYKDLKKIVEQIETYNLKVHNGGKVKVLNYKLSDNAKFNLLWSLLNVNFNKENEWLVEYDICEIYDQYAIVKNYNEGIWERVYYVKDDETDSLEITERVRCYFVDVTEAEKSALDALHKMNNESYEKVDENYQAARDEAEEANCKLAEKSAEYEALNEANAALVQSYEALSEVNTALTENFGIEKSNFESKIEELNETNATLTTERDAMFAQLGEANVAINALTAQNEELTSFKLEVEKQRKQEVVDKYSSLLDEEVLGAYSAKLDNYTTEQLDKELAYELVNANQTIFTAAPQSGYIPKDEPQMSGLEEILSKYSKK